MGYILHVIMREGDEVMTQGAERHNQPDIRQVRLTIEQGERTSFSESLNREVC